MYSNLYNHAHLYTWLYYTNSKINISTFFLLFCSAILLY